MHSYLSKSKITKHSDYFLVDIEILAIKCVYIRNVRSGNAQLGVAYNTTQTFRRFVSLCIMN